MNSCPSLWPARTQKWKILLIGDQEVGKTSFAHREYYKSDNVIFNVAHIKECYLDDNNFCIASLSDTFVAQTDYRDMEEEMPSCDGYIILYSIASRSSFQEVSRICRQIPLNGRQDPNLMLILAGTKSDLKSSRQVSTEEGLALAKELGCEAFYETSAKSGENVDAVVLSMVQALRRAAASRDMDMMAPFRMMRNLFRGEKS